MLYPYTYNGLISLFHSLNCTDNIDHFFFFLLQYIFFFQLPYLPEFFIEMNDFKMLGPAFKVLADLDRG